VIHRPRSSRRTRADALKKTKVSTAIGSKKYRVLRSTYVSSLRVAAISAAAPASEAALSTYDSASGPVTVTSQHKDLPLCEGTRVTPSDLLPSDRSNLTSSLETGTPAEAGPVPPMVRNVVLVLVLGILAVIRFSIP